MNNALLHLVLLVKNRAADRDRGATALEYGLIIALIGLAVAAGAALLAPAIGNMFSHAASVASSANTGP
jgi:Flp pilus assembly pilin Flp